VAGSVSAGAGRIEAPIGRDPGRRTRMAVVPSGRPSTTGYRVRERFDGWTFLELDLVTGRTHQIRVHLEAIGHPVAGDPMYGTGTSRRGPDGLARLFLHAWRLELTSPSSGRLIRAEAPLPPALETVLEGLRGRGGPGR
jgi:23S rRNA pseudouridine1911/1915/1917 synthase